MPDRQLLSPLDGRYRGVTEPLVDYLSEFALNRARLKVEAEWLIFLAASGAVAELPPLTDAQVGFLRELPGQFDDLAARELARLEALTRHDVKAVEYFLKAKLSGTSLEPFSEFVHFCCTSEDINNLAYGLMLRDAMADVWRPAAGGLQRDILALAAEHRDLPMLARTHGQPATPTTLGKELAVFAHRLGRQLSRISGQEYLGKFNGATGTFGAHAVAVPGADWAALSRGFVESLGLTWNPLTTQIESHDYVSELFADVARFNGIVHNLDTDIWTYISLGYFRQVRGLGTVGSSTMPHKINPIRFENSEANCELSNALLRSLGETLITSRLQRDLTDSTTLRNMGVALGHSLVALDNCRTGLAGLDVDAAAIAADLSGAWEVIGEAVQTVMRRRGIAGSYELLKEMLRGRDADQETLAAFIRAQQLPPADEKALLELTPSTYIGLAPALVSFAEPAPAGPGTNAVQSH
ncbi:MAG TPA: adenylosuccinate lyase [Streptosporangiaceae bacterium]|nr:adenylosuccinate lyase [Streptosporangiaceae bacterium]